jgi:hypothetical protein
MLVIVATTNQAKQHASTFAAAEPVGLTAGSELRRKIRLLFAESTRNSRGTTPTLATGMIYNIRFKFRSSLY